MVNEVVKVINEIYIKKGVNNVDFVVSKIVKLIDDAIQFCVTKSSFILKKKKILKEKRKSDQNIYCSPHKYDE